MAIQCPDCGHTNRNEMMFCEECGTPIDPKTRLIMELEGKLKKDPVDDDEYIREDDDDYIPSIRSQMKKKNGGKSSAVRWILILACVAALIYFVFLK